MGTGYFCTLQIKKTNFCSHILLQKGHFPLEKSLLLEYTVLDWGGAVWYGWSECARGPCTRAEFLGICETEEMVLPFSPVPCSNISSCRVRADAEPDVVFEQGGLGRLWRHLSFRSSWEFPFPYVCPGGHCLVCVVAEQDNFLFMTECFMFSHGKIFFSIVHNSPVLLRHHRFPAAWSCVILNSSWEGSWRFAVGIMMLQEAVLQPFQT